MSVLRIHLFGGMDLSQGDHLLPGFPTQKARDLFAFLVLHRARSFPRDVLVGVFWGDRPESAARRNLRTDLWRIRRVLSTAGSPAAAVLVAQDHQVGFDSGAACWLDVAEFERRIGAAAASPTGELTREDVQRLQEAVDLYRGDLLEEVYDDWCLYERERLRLLYLSALERLMAHHQARREWDAAIAAGQRLLHADAALEHVHRNLIRCYQHQGNRPAALRQFALCEEILRTELDVEPMEETLAVYEQVRAADSAAPASVPGAPAGVVQRAEHLLAEVEATLSELHRVTTRLERSRRQLSRALEPPDPRDAPR